MIALPKHTEVLIVGAGPSGLMMAAQLLRYGVIPTIIDTRQGPTNHSKALAVQARSLEIYRQMGVIAQVLKEGKPAGGAMLHRGEEVIASLPLRNAGTGQTPYPYVLMFPQSKNERVLLDHLTLNCCPVYWQTSLVALKQTADGVEAELETGGNTQTLTCNYVIGADGAHSVVRKQLGIAFNGDTYQHKFYLADVKINNAFTDDFVHLYLSGKGFAGFFLMPEAGNFRVVGNLPAILDNDAEKTFDDVLPHLRAITALPLDVEQVNWFTIYKLHHRMADKFNDGRCFLVGDAAHIHSPVGGQGMNTGLQDAYNLAWKLAGVVNRQFAPGILNSYAEERMPVARDLLNSTDKVFNMVTSQSLFSNFIKRFIVPPALKFFWKKDKMRTAFFKGVSQTGINYRDSKLNLHLSHNSQIKAGDRLPYLEIFDKKKQEKTDIHAWCSKPGFTLVTIGIIQENYLFALAKWITQRYNQTLNFFHLPPSEKNQHILDAFEIRPGQRKALIIRPDMHIGYMNDAVDIELMDNYLRDVVGFTA
ncbi:FAD-dependent monooxygenase [Mucilaginibacter sp. ZT4R22]|uniref:FAD-dependent monooxygenase n=1 Tax=Mucilaginibacter pankratovii TaxID=2772110 RepID=A0ABR7WTX7_9SPHI|nr:FAD-dependent monooxygenase [Mucilaginibacter pankratovii]MBD1365740.1 FAD-dependent monooxygenase [Mucilaginibacter pankratovii]